MIQQKWKNIVNSQLIIEKYQNKELYDLCCSESIFYAANEYYDLNFDDNCLKISAAFCGGNLTEDTCGILTAAIAIIAVKFSEGVSHQSLQMHEYVREFTEIFNNRWSCNNCLKLKNQYRDINYGCKSLIVESFILLTDFIDSKL